MPTTPFEQLEAIANRLNHHKDLWVQVSIPKRITYLRQCIAGVMAIAQPWVEAACRAKGIDPNSNLAGEEWVAGPACTVRNLRLLIQALEAGGQPNPSHWHIRPDGQAIAQVFPETWIDRILWAGFNAEVWLEPEQPSTQGAIYRQTNPGQVALVLGAGNVSSIAAQDTLYKLFAQNQVVILKMNPVNEYMGAFLEQAFQPLRQHGFFEIVYGGAEVGAYLCEHTQIDTIHITGSHQTYDAIVWGSTSEEQQQRQATNTPKLSKPVTAELGCVTPILVVPGVWSQADLAFQARHVASMVAHNASFNCVAGKVLVTAKGWDQREAFLTQLHQELAQTPARQAYYPGAQQRYQAFLDRYPQAKPLGDRTDAIVPWTVIPDVAPYAGEYALTQEAFCGVLAEVSLDATNASTFLKQAVEFANEKCWGSLSCVLLIHPQTQKAVAKELDAAIATLRYGSIGINVWTGIGYWLCATTWGAFPGHSSKDICSGQGVVHNAYLFDHPQKSVIRAPFRIFPTPTWFTPHKNLLKLGQRLTAFEASPNVSNLLRVVAAALKG